MVPERDQFDSQWWSENTKLDDMGQLIGGGEEIRINPKGPRHNLLNIDLPDTYTPNPAIDAIGGAVGGLASRIQSVSDDRFMGVIGGAIGIVATQIRVYDPFFGVIAGTIGQVGSDYSYYWETPNQRINRVLSAIVSDILFETLNAKSTMTFKTIQRDAEQGNLSRIDYIVLNEHEEFENLKKHHDIAKEAVLVGKWPAAVDDFAGPAIRWSGEDGFNLYMAAQINSYQQGKLSHSDELGADWDKKYQAAWLKKHAGNPYTGEAADPLSKGLPPKMQLQLERAIGGVRGSLP